MDFDEWFADAIWGNEDFKESLRRAWEAATDEEREACAKVCEEDAFVDQWYGLAEAAKRIRERSND
jgi:hypothetical protein